MVLTRKYTTESAQGNPKPLGIFGILDPPEVGDMVDADVQIAEKRGLRLVDLMGLAESPPFGLAPTLGIPEGAVNTSYWADLAPSTAYFNLFRPLANLLLLALVVPVVLALALPIALANLITFRDPRLVFYSQARMGQLGRTFRIYKFRTMRPIQGSNFSAWSDGDKNRVTAFGSFLRSTHLDEIPQILNIILGNMDFIGPRPEMVEIHEWAVANVEGFERRLVLRPGITGLAQITQGYAGQCAEAYGHKLTADDAYLTNMSASLDVSILFRTAVWMARGKGWSWNKKERVQAKIPSGSKAR